MATLALGFLLGLGLLFAWRGPRTSPAADGTGEAAPVRLAVLPFENLGDSSDGYFADGVTDAVRGKLAALPRMQVTASTSSGRYRQTTKTPQEIASELGVDYLLVGRIRWAKGPDGQGRVQVSPELIRAANASTTWQQPFDAQLADVFRMQADVAGRVAQALGIALGAGDQDRLHQRPTENLAAYDALLRGEPDLPEWGSDAVRRAIAAYEDAVRLDTNFALGWARLSEARTKGSRLGMFDRTTAEAAAERAIRLAPDRGDGYRALALAAWRDAPRAHELLRRAVALSPNDPRVLGSLGHLEIERGATDSGLAHLRRARELDPQSVALAEIRTESLQRLRRLEEAEREADFGLELQPGSRTLLRRKVELAMAAGDVPRARAMVARLGSGAEANTALALFWMWPWILDEPRQQIYMSLPPAAFGGNPIWHANSQAIMARARGDTTRMRTWADSGLRAGTTWWQDTTTFAFKQAIRGMLLAMAGRPTEARSQARKAAVRDPTVSDSYYAYVLHLAAWIEVMAGESEAAIDLLVQMLEQPYEVTPAQLRIDPAWAPLRSNPRFQRLVRGPEGAT